MKLVGETENEKVVSLPDPCSDDAVNDDDDYAVHFNLNDNDDDTCVIGRPSAG